MDELFEKFEVNRTPRWPKLARTLALSLVAHAAFALLVIYSPTLQAALHLASVMSGAEYGDEDYTLGEMRERAVMLGPAPNEKLYYPPGYFKTDAPPAPNAEVVEEPTPTPTPLPKPKPTPKPMPAATPQATPEVAANNQNANAGEGGEAELSEEEKKAKREKEEREALDKIAEQSKVKLPPKINGKPFKDLLAKWNKERENGRLNLNETVSITVEADRNEDGTLSKPELTGKSANDPVMEELAKEVALTLSASRALEFLQGARHLKMTLSLDQKKLNVVVDTELESAESASSMARVYGLGIGLRRFQKGGTDEGEVWKNTKVISKGKSVVVNFEMPRETAGSLLAKQVGKPSSGQ